MMKQITAIVNKKGIDKVEDEGIKSAKVRDSLRDVEYESWKMRHTAELEDYVFKEYYHKLKMLALSMTK